MSNSNLNLIMVIIITGLISLASVKSTFAGICGPPPNCPACTTSLDCENAFGCIIGEESCENPGACCDPENGCCDNVGSCINGLDEYTCTGELEGAWQGMGTTCEEICSGPTPTPGPTTTFHQVGGVASGDAKKAMCCPFYSDDCAPCGNPAQGFSYQTPNACDSAVSYQNLWVRCQDPTCNNLKKGSYTIQVCHLDTQDPSTGGTPDCGEPCVIDSSNNHCNGKAGTSEVPEGEMIYLMIVPSTKPGPNAPMKGLWTALVEGCDNQGHIDPFCGDGIINGDEQCERDSDCSIGEYCGNNCLCLPFD